jgi:hypothetical protein
MCPRPLSSSTSIRTMRTRSRAIPHSAAHGHKRGVRAACAGGRVRVAACAPFACARGVRVCRDACAGATGLPVPPTCHQHPSRPACALLASLLLTRGRWRAWAAVAFVRADGGPLRWQAGRTPKKKYGHFPNDWMLGESCWPAFRERVQAQYNYSTYTCHQTTIDGLHRGKFEQCTAEAERLCVKPFCTPRIAVVSYASAAAEAPTTVNKPATQPLPYPPRLSHAIDDSTTDLSYPGPRLVLLGCEGCGIPELWRTLVAARPPGGRLQVAAVNPGEPTWRDRQVRSRHHASATTRRHHATRTLALATPRAPLRCGHVLSFEVGWGRVPLLSLGLAGALLQPRVPSHLIPSIHLPRVTGALLRP